MDRQERGQRNLEKLRQIATAYSGRVTFWNPTEADKTSMTVHFTDARLVTRLYEMMNAENQEGLVRAIASVYGFQKVQQFAWSKAEYRTVSAY